MVRSKEGKKVYAKMSEGEGGFLLAQFEGDANPVQTEVPNLVLHGAGMVPEKRPGADKKAAAKKAAAKKAAAKKAVAKKPAGLLPSDDLEGPNDADPDAAPNDAAPSAAKSVSADPPAFDPPCALASLNEVLSHVLFQQPHHWYQGYCGGQVEADHELWRFESW